MTISSRCLVLVLFAATCGGSDGPKATGRECAGTAEASKSCQGQVCIGLEANPQKKTGICSEVCTAEGEGCGDDEICVGPLADNNNYCAHSCATDKDCSDGFVCVALDAEDGICFVEQGGADPGTGADCESKDCVISTDAEMINGYCAGQPGTKKLCDCPTTDVPASCTPTDPAALNLYCCP